MELFVQIINKVVDIVFKGFDLYDAVRAKFIKDELDYEQPKMAEKSAAPTPAKTTKPLTDRAPDSVVQNAVKVETKEAPQKTAKTTTSSKKATSKKSATSKRKGSVDRSGQEIESVAAEKVVQYLKEHNIEISLDDIAYEKKAVVGRVIWCLSSAQKARVRGGLTTKDMAALIYQYFGMDIYPTNLARACRQHSDLFEAGETRNRAKCYVLTAKGKKTAKSLFA